MGLKDDLAIICMSSRRCPEKDREPMDMAGIIIVYDKYICRMATEFGESFNIFFGCDPDKVKKKHDSLKVIMRQLMQDVATATDALAVLNVYQRAYHRYQRMEYLIDYGEFANSDAEWNAWFDGIKTTTIMPFVPSCARDVETIAEIRETSAERVRTVMNIIDTAKALTGLA